MGRLLGIGVLAIILVAVGVGQARADDRPWARGVPLADQEQATKLFLEGNELLNDGLFAKALDRYRKALRHWKHPSIHFNAAVSLINLEQPLEAYKQLQQAMRFGDQALDREVSEQAEMYQRLLERQIGTLRIECQQPGTRISVDGKQLVVCPARRAELLLAGKHQVVAARDGYLTRTASLDLPGGVQHSVQIELIPLDQATVTRRRWAVWKPWAVVGAGVALAAVGGIAEARSEANFESYDNAVAELCAARPCDELPGVVTDAYDTAVLQNRLAVGLFAAGGIGVAAGVVLAILNRPIREQIGYDDVVITPHAGDDSVGATLGVRF